MRAFIGVPIDPHVIENIIRFQSELGKDLSDIRWVPRENLHLTLKFLGSIDEKKLEPLNQSLRACLADTPRFPVRTRGIGVFPDDIRRPRVLWVGLEATALEPVAASIEDAVHRLGFPREGRKFTPHLTIGRWRQTRFNVAADLRKTLAKRENEEFGTFWVNEVIVFESTLRPTGAVYSSLEVFLLKDGS